MPDRATAPAGGAVNSLGAEDYEVRVQVDFENRLLRPLSVGGVSDADAKTSEILVFERDCCRPGCTAQDCRRCRARKLYQDLAGDPRGAVTFRPDSEYLYCLRLHRRQQARAILSLTPREQNVEIRELGLLAYWFATWFEREQRVGGGGGSPQWPAAPAADNAEADGKVAAAPEQTPPTQVVAEATADAVAEGGIPVGSGSPQPEEGAAAGVSRLLNSSSKYLPNLRIVYQVKQERMTVTMPQPDQLTRELDVLLARGGDDLDSAQVATLRPGHSYASQELVVPRDSAHTLMVKLRDSGSALRLLDLVTEKRVLRVQESLLAPKHMNFLMERRVDQRATFVLHITFDERDIVVEEKPLGEFYLDVDFDRNSLNIGTVPGNEKILYRVEELHGPNQADWSKAHRILRFEGGVDPATNFIQKPVPIHHMADYLITVINTESGLELPTSVLCIGTKSLYVKEVKGSDARLHVTVQRQFDPTAAAAATANAVTNASNCPVVEVGASNHWQHSRPDGAFQSQSSSGRARYRVQHNATTYIDVAAAARNPAIATATTSSDDATSGAAAAAASDASCHSSGAASGSDSGLGRNASSRSDSLDSLAAHCQQRRRLHRRREREAAVGQQPQQHLQEPLPPPPQPPSDTGAVRQPDLNVNLDVDLPRLQARLLPGGSGGGSGNKGTGCYLIVEDPLHGGGGSRSIPCQLGQAFSVQHWCRYTVKAIGDASVTALFTFSLTDTDVTDIRSCNPAVHLTKNSRHR